MARGGVRGWIWMGVAGAVLGGATLLIPVLLKREAAFGFLAVLLGMIASVYLGYALADGRLRIFGIEYMGLILFGALATVAIALESAWVLASGYFGHGVWDAIHHRKAVDTAMPRWYVPLCLGYDAVVGAYVLIRFA